MVLEHRQVGFRINRKVDPDGFLFDKSTSIPHLTPSAILDNWVNHAEQK